MKKLIFPLLLLLFPAAFAVMQDEMPAPRLDITGVVSTSLPTAAVTVEVIDRTGQPIGGLTEENFTLSGELAEYAEIVKVENLRDDNLSFATVLMIDVSSSMAGRPFELAKEAAREFITSIGPNDPVAIMVFGSGIRLLQDYTTDKAVLLNTIDALPLGGETNLYGGALAGVEKAAEAPTARRAVVLLSDGAHYLQAVESDTPRSAALETASVRGVPVYTIGLGYGTDRSFLASLSESTNGRFYESPNPEQLLTIFSDLAALFRSLYVITLEVDVPLDGTEYDFTLVANTDAGTSNEDSAVLRAPIPVPLVNLEPQAFEAPLDAPVEFTATVIADEETDGAFELTGEALPDAVGAFSRSLPAGGEVIFPITYTENFPLNPFAYPPGSYTLTYSATDASGDTGTASVDFEIAPLPAVVTVSPDLSSLGEISEPTTITLEVSEQTPTTGVRFSVAGELVGEDNEAPFEFTLEPSAFAPSEPHTLTVEVTSASEAVSVTEQTFTVAAFAPEITISGLEADELLESPRPVTVEISGQTPGAEVVFAVDGETLATDSEAPFEFTLEPFAFDASQVHTLQVTVTNTGGQSAAAQVSFRVIAPSPTPTATSTVTPSPTIDFGATDASATQAAQTTLDAQATSDTLSTSTAEIRATADAVATEDALNQLATATALTATVLAQQDAEATESVLQTSTAQAEENTAATESAAQTSTAHIERDAQTTVEARETESAMLTLTAQAEADTAATESAAQTSTVQGERDAQETQDAAATESRAALLVATRSAAETASAVPTDTAEPTDVPTEAVTATIEASPTEVPTQVAQIEPTVFDPTVTPVSPTEVTAPGAPPQDNMLPLIAIGCGLLLLIGLALFFLFARRRNNR